MVLRLLHCIPAQRQLKGRTTAFLRRRLVQCNAAWEHRREALTGEQASLQALQAQRAELDGSGLAARLQEATAGREAAHAAHKQCALCRSALLGAPAV